MAGWPLEPLVGQASTRGSHIPATECVVNRCPSAVATSRVDLVKSFPHRRLNRAEQPNKLHPIIWCWMSKIAGATVVGQGICQRPYDQLALSFGDHDLVFVGDRHV